MSTVGTIGDSDRYNKGQCRGTIREINLSTVGTIWDSEGYNKGNHYVYGGYSKGQKGVQLGKSFCLLWVQLVRVDQCGAALHFDD